MFITPTNPIILDPSGPASGLHDPMSTAIGIMLVATLVLSVASMLGTVVWVLWDIWTHR